MYDIAVELYYANLDDTTIQIKDHVRKLLTRIVQDHPQQAAHWFLNPFAKSSQNESDEECLVRKQKMAEEVENNIKQCSQKQQITTVSEDEIVNQKFSIVQESEITDLSQRTATASLYNINDQTEVMSDWFNACRGGQMDLVRKVCYAYKGMTDTRPTDTVALTQNGFTGLMYAVAYQQRDVFNYIVQDEASYQSAESTLFQYLGQYYYVPKGSTALHIAVLVRNEEMIAKLMSVDPGLFDQYNSLRITPFHLMVQRGYMTEEFMQLFVQNITIFHFTLAVKNAFAAQNDDFVRLLIKYRQTRILEEVYRLVFRVSKQFRDGQLKPETNHTESILLDLEDEALSYAFAKTADFERSRKLGSSAQTGCVWRDELEAYFQAEYESAFKEYTEVKQFKDLGRVCSEEEKIIAADNVVADLDYIVKAPSKSLLMTRRDKARVEWFDACKAGVVEKVLEMAPEMAGSVDVRFNNVERGEFQGFTGLLYAVYSDEVDVFKALLPLEGRMRAQGKNVLDVWIKSMRQGGQDSHLNYLTFPGLGLVELVLLRGSGNIFAHIMQFEDLMQICESEKEQLQLNVLLRSLREELSSPQCCRFYH